LMSAPDQRRSIRRLRPLGQPKSASARVNAERRVFHTGSFSSPPHQHADAPHAVALLRARQERPCRRRTAKSSDEVAPSKANAHLHLPWPSRLSTSAHARLPRTGSRLRGRA
jgi:hypothetical protein